MRRRKASEESGDGHFASDLSVDVSACRSGARRKPMSGRCSVVLRSVAFVMAIIPIDNAIPESATRR